MQSRRSTGGSAKKKCHLYLIAPHRHKVARNPSTRLIWTVAGILPSCDPGKASSEDRHSRHGPTRETTNTQQTSRAPVALTNLSHSQSSKGGLNAMADRIPTELIDHIFSFAVLLDRRTCASVCCLNTHGRAIATPHLYEEVGTQGRAPKRRQKLSKLCRTLVTNRDLARRVGKVTQCVDRDTVKCGNRPRSPPIDEGAWRRLSQELGPSAQSIDVYINSMISGQTGNGLEDNLICIMLLACPKVQILELQGHLECLFEFHSFRKVLELQAGANMTIPTTPARTLLGSIQELRLNGDHGASVELVDCVLDLPGLGRIVIDRFIDDEDSIPEISLSAQAQRF